MTDNLTIDTKSPYWENVLLTDSGFYDPFDLSQPLHAIIDKFAHMVGKPFNETRVLFIPGSAGYELIEETNRSTYEEKQNEIS